MTVFATAARISRGRRRVMAGLPILALAIPMTLPSQAAGQSLDGYASVLFNVLPNADTATGQRQPIVELRPRLLVETRAEIGATLRLTAAGFAEALVADRRTGSVINLGIVRPQELHAEFVWPKADLRIGISRVNWGRLDEFLPTDVVNPLDLARFFMEGRVEARMPVGMIRGRLLASDRFNIETIYVPLFRRGRFDQLGEETSPFNLTPAEERRVEEPSRALKNGQGGVRINATTGRVDWSITAYRGFESLPIYEVDSAGPALTLTERFPRFDMVGGDFETVGGAWGVRGEVAWFLDRVLQAINQPFSGKGNVVEAGLGIDRTAGTYRVGANVLVTKRRPSAALPVEETDTLIVASIDRSFARETRHLRTFAVYDTNDRSVFARAIASFAVRDNVTLEISGAWFDGQGLDVFSRLGSRDYAYARLKVFF